jgi:nitrite reductase (cytochrome c-552)
MKVSDHHVRSPLLNVNNACQTCHKAPEDELKARVRTIQDRTFEMRNLALDALVEFIGDIRDARKAGVAADVLTSAQLYQRHAQFLADFVEAENSMGFHAPQESARLLATSIDYSRKGQRVLRGQSAAPTFTTSATAELQPKDKWVVSWMR